MDEAPPSLLPLEHPNPTSDGVRVHPRPFYYLENFLTALTWLQRRYDDLLTEEEGAFINTFRGLRTESSALLVRMIGRQGDLFRTTRLNYPEIGCAQQAAEVLVDLGWLDARPLLALAELGRLLRKAELLHAFRAGPSQRGVRKAELLQSIECDPGTARPLTDWWPEAPDAAYRVVINPLCERLRLMFFGNFRQTWSEFVLADLGIFKYEKVDFSEASRAFQTRHQIETFHALYRLRQRLEGEGIVDATLNDFPPPVDDNPWLEGKRAQLLFRIAQRFEQQRNLERAIEIYCTCRYPGARTRVVRLLERLGRYADAAEVAAQVEQHPADDVERQQLTRMWPRLRRKLGLTTQSVRRIRHWPTFEVMLPGSLESLSVERAVGETLAQEDAPVHYVENGLINSLFGLLCWDALFAAIPGAFFHEFQSAPADLFAPDFHARRASLFERCFAQLESGAYRETILRNFNDKTGIQSGFVFWGLLSLPLLDLALACVPAAHLKQFFERILLDVRANRCGLPDLIQFWPQERRYRLVEVKGPGDRLQDNQIRWLEFCARHAIPVEVCHAKWAQPTSEQVCS